VGKKFQKRIGTNNLEMLLFLKSYNTLFQRYHSYTPQNANDRVYNDFNNGKPILYTIGTVFATNT